MRVIAQHGVESVALKATREMFWTTQHTLLFASSVVSNFTRLKTIYYDLPRAGDWKALSRMFCYSLLSLKFKQ